MPLTTPDNIFYADGSTPLSVEAISAAEATSIQEALTNSRAIRSFKWADQDAQDNQIDMQAGDEGYRIDTRANYRYNGTQWKRSEGGLVLIRPTSVAGTGVAMNESGRVVFTAGTAINVNGCFSDDFDNYRVVLDIHTVSAAANFSVRLRTAGTDNLDNLYDSQRLTISAATATANSSTSTSWLTLGVGLRARHGMTMDILDPRQARYTAARATVFSIDAGINSAIMEHGLWHRSTLLFDGISILNTGGTLTGTLAIYGYNQ